MLNPSVEIIQLLAVFSTAMTAPTFRNALTLLYGAILAPGRRTVTTALRAMGLEKEKNFSNYHQVLNRARWSCGNDYPDHQEDTTVAAQRRD